MRQPGLQVAQLLVHLRGAIQIIPELRLIHFLRQLVDLLLHVTHMQSLARRQNLLTNGVHIRGVLFQFDHRCSRFLCFTVAFLRPPG